MTPDQLQRAEQMAKEHGSLVISEVDNPDKLHLPKSAETCMLSQEDEKRVYPNLARRFNKPTSYTPESIEEAKVPKWDQCRGNHTKALPDPGVTYPGLVSFREHMDQPLSAALWIDLTFRMKVRKIRVRRERECLKSDDWPDCVVVVDEDDVVRELYCAPHVPDVIKTGRAVAKSTDMADRWPEIVFSLSGLERADFS